MLSYFVNILLYSFVVVFHQSFLYASLTLFPNLIYQMDELSQLGELPGSWEDRRVELIESHAQLLSAYANASRELEKQADLTFKPSTMKGMDHVEFLPTNLHVQRMWVCERIGNVSKPPRSLTHILSNLHSLVPLVKRSL